MKNKKLLIVSFFVLAITFSSVFAIFCNANQHPGKTDDTTDNGNNDGDGNNNTDDTTKDITQAQYDTALKSLVVDANNDPSAKTTSV